MFKRIVMIIDDNKEIERTYIPNYKSRIEGYKKNSGKEWKFEFIHKRTMDEAQEYLETTKIVDVLVVDYDFNREGSYKNGTEFVHYVREKINRQCKIIFYTMQGISSIDKDELVSLINSDIFRIIDKNTDNNDIAKAIFDAAIACNPVVLSLERFLEQYSNILTDVTYNVHGNTYTLDEIIAHIRMDDDIGRTFIEKLLYTAIIKETNLTE